MRFSLFLVVVMAIFTASCFNLASAQPQAGLKAIEAIWKRTSTKFKAVNAFKDAGKAKAQANAAAESATKLRTAQNWKNLADKIKAERAVPKRLDTSNSKWITMFEKLTASGVLKNTDKAKLVQITEKVGAEIAKKPSKWRTVWKTLAFLVGAATGALIFLGVESMF